LLLLLNNSSYAYSMANPFHYDTEQDKPERRANFGEYRKYYYPATGTYYEEFHTGIDLGKRKSGIKVFPLEAGEIATLADMDASYGWSVVVKHNGNNWQSSYSHLKEGSTSGLVISDSVDTQSIIGTQGSTGNSTGLHLHLCVGDPDIYWLTSHEVTASDGKKKWIQKLHINYAKVKNPLSEGLNLERDTTRAGTCEVHLVDLDTKKEIRGSSVLWNSGKKIRILASAYDHTTLRYYKTNPFKITFAVYDTADNELIFKEQIEFKDLKFNKTSVANVKDIYNLDLKDPNGKEIYKTRSVFNSKEDINNNIFYFYKDWEPPAFGKFKVVVCVYNLDSGNEVSNSSSERIVNMGTIGFDINWSVFPSAVEEEKTVDYFDISNTFFSTNTSNLRGIYQTYFTSKSQSLVHWSIELYDSSDRLIKTIDGGTGTTLEAVWDGSNSSGSKVLSGNYSYKVFAESNGNKHLINSGLITIDNDLPTLYGTILPSISIVTTSSESISFTINPAEDLDSTVVDVLDEYGEIAIIIANSAQISKDENFQVIWEDPFSLPNGNYKLHVSLVDKAGNTNNYYAPIYIQIPMNPEKPKPPPEDYPRPIPPPYNDRPIISDIAFDSSGNQYVLYARYGKLIKYDPNGNILKETSGEASELICPLGLAVSPSGDRVYVADTYANRVLLYDGNLRHLSSISGGVVKSLRKLKVTTYWGFGLINTGSNLSDSPAGNFQISSSFFKPTDVRISPNGGVYVTDSSNHRLLKLSQALIPESVFEGVVFDKTQEASKFYSIGNSWVRSNGVDYCYFWSNALNDSLEWLNNWYSFYAFQEIAKPQILNYSTANGQFTSPESVAVDSSGNLYIADTGNNRIQKFAPDGSFISKFGSEGSGTGQFKSPQGIYVDEDNHIWVADTGNQRIQEFKLDGTFIKSWGDSKLLSKPLKLVVKKISKNKAVYVADGDKNEVQIFGASPPTDFRLTKTGDQLVPSRTFTISWTTSEADWYGLKKYEVYCRIVHEGMDENDENTWVYLKKDIPPTAASTTVDLSYDGLYDIKVRAIDNNGNWRDSDGGSSSGDTKDPSRNLRVHIDAIPPLGFALESPPDGFRIDGKDVRIAWSEAQDKNLDHYDVVVGTDPNDIHGTAVYSATFEATATREVWLRDLPRSKYYIYIAVYDKAGHYCRLDGQTDVPGYAYPQMASSWGAAWPFFEIDPLPPDPFSISNLYDGEFFDDRNLKIAWNPAHDRDLDRYELYIGKDKTDIMGTAIYSTTLEASMTECSVNLPGGTYWIYMRAYDKLGNFRGLDGKTNAPKHDLDRKGNLISFEIDRTPPTVMFNHTVFPPLSNPYFSPNGDGKKDSTIINYYVGDDSYWKVNYLWQNEVTIEVKGEIVKDGQIVASWTNRSPPGWQAVLWDGINAGTRVPDGIYTVRITATDKALNTATDESLSVVVDTTPPEISNVASSGIFSPNGDGKFDTDTLNFGISDNLSETVEAAIEVISPEGQSIWNKKEPRRLARLPDGQVAGSDSVSVVWDGTRDSGLATRDGEYHYRITTTDQAGNASTSSASITVDTTPPAITNVSTNPKNEVTFTNTSGQLDFSFRVSEPANVGLTIYDSNHSLLHDAVTSAEPGANRTISWDGKDTFGEFVPDNTYINYTFAATDQVANSSSYRPTHVVRVNTPVTGLAGNILYSPDGMVKIIIPSGAVPERAELYIDEYDTPSQSYRVGERDNVTITYRLGSRGSTNEVVFKKTPVLVMQYDTSVLKFENQTIELWRRGSGWSRLFGNTSGNIYTAYVDKTSDFALFADLTPPPPPVISQAESPTASEKITISGTAEPFSKVDLWINGLKRSPPVETGSSGSFSVEIVLTEGVNTLRATATDQTGNESPVSETTMVVLDRTPPTITLISPQTIYISPNGDGIDDEALISASSDGASMTISVRDNSGNILASSSSDSLTWGDSSVAEGTYTYVIKAFDALGNEAKKEGKIVIDKTRPEAYLYADPITNTISGILSLSGIAEDTNFERYILEYGAGENPSSWTEIKQSFVSVNYQKLFDFDTRILSDGVYTFKLTAYDKAGNSKSYTIKKLIINADLSGSISYPAMNQVISGTIEVQGEIHGENFAEYRVEYGMGTSPSSWVQVYRSLTFPTGSLLASWNTTQIPDGTYTLRLNVINIGNRSTYYTMPVVVDNGNPSVAIASPVANTVLGGTIEVDASISDANSSYYKVEYASSSDPNNWQIIQGPTYSISHPLASWNTASLNGDYIIKVMVVDVVGNSSFGTTIITVDNTSPEASIGSPTLNQVVSKTIQVQGAANDLHFSNYKLEYQQGASWTEFASSSSPVQNDILGTLDTTALPDGINIIKLTVTDQAGNTNESTVNIVVDNTNPTASVAFPTPSLVVANTISIIGTAIDEAHFKEFKVEYGAGESPTSWTQIGSTHSTSAFGSTLEVWDTTQVADGIYTLKLTTKDIVNNASISEVKVIVDNTYPTVAISNPTDGNILAGTINIAGTVSDANMNSILLEYRIASSSESWQAIAALDPVNIANSTIYNWGASSLNGDYVIRVKATDKTGKTTSDEVQVRLDNIPPIINITSPTRESVNTGIVGLTGEISDLNIDRYTIKYGYGIQPTRWWDLISGSSVVLPPSSIVTWNTPNVKDGYYTLKFDAIDKAGNSYSREFVITIDNAPAVAKIHKPVADQAVRGTLTVEGIACDADFTTYNFKRFEVLYGAGTNPISWTTVESLVVPKINEVLTNWNTAGFADGTYTLKLRSQDISGTTEATRTVIIDNTLPTASIASPSQGQTISGTVSVTGTASDTNISEYKVYYKRSDSSSWTEIGSGTSSINNSTLASWNTIAVGDGSYSIKLWTKDRAGNEREITRDVTVNNILAVVNDSATPMTISPNADGIDDVARINYTLSETSPVTVKIYKKPQYDIYKWEAKGFGTRYPIQKFSYTIGATGTDHPDQPFSYTLSASGTQYPTKQFEWKVNAGGTEYYYVSSSGSIVGADFNGEVNSSLSFVYSTTSHETISVIDGGKYGPLYTDWGEEFSGLYNPYSADKKRYVGAIINYGDIFLDMPTPSVTISGTGIKTPPNVEIYEQTSSSSKARIIIRKYIYDKNSNFVKDWMIPPGDVTFSWNVTGRKSSSVFTFDSRKATIDRNNSITGNNYSVNLLAEHPGGTIGDNRWIGPGYENSYHDSVNYPYVSTWRTGAWSGNANSGTINATYNYPGDAWSSSTSPSETCRSGPNSVTYNKAISGLINVPGDVPSATFTLSGNTNPNVFLRFSDTGTSTTTNCSASVVGNTSYAPAWSGSDDKSDSCNALSGIRIVSGSVRTMSSIFGAPNEYPDYREYSSFSVSNNNSNVFLRFNYSGRTSTSNPNDYLIASTSSSESWDTSKDPRVGSGGWIKSGEISLPFNYDESSQSFSTNYTPPSSDIVLNSWTVNLKNLAGGTSTDVRLDGTPTASGNFKVKISDSMLVKTLQFNASTASGGQAIEWDGRNSGGSFVPDGDYIYYIYAGPNIVKKSGVVKVRRSSEISASSISDIYISPNGDGIKENLAINYNLTENAAVVIEVTDKNGTVFKSFTGPGNQGANSSSWDGRNGSGTVVEDGEYTIRVKATHSNGTLRTKELKVIVDNNSLTAGETPAQKLASGGSDPVFSSDKSKIAFVKEVSGKKQIFMTNLQTANSLQLTAIGSNAQPCWSPDGNKMAYTSDRSGNNNIWLMNADRSNKKQITSDNASETSPVFSPDGQKISYASNRTGRLGIDKWNIWTVSLDGKNPAQITADENTAMDDFPSYSPDGKKLIYASDQSGNFDLWTINLDGSSKVQLISSSEAEMTPVWSPDGLKVAYVRGSDIYIRKIANTEEVKAATGINPAWARDGTEVIYNTASGDIYSKRVCAGTLTGVITQPILSQTLTGLAEIRGTASDTNFENYRLEFSSNTLPYTWTEIASSSKPVNNGILGVWNTAAVPDGEYILRLIVNDRAGNSLQNTIVVNADNDNWKLTITELKQLTSHEAWDIEPAWSPDGTKIAFSSNRSGNYDVWVMNADGTGLRNLTNDPAYDSKPVWSPDGIRIAFVSDRSGNKDIWVVNADGSGTPQQLTNLTIIDTDPTWSPDNSKIAFASNRSDNFDIWLINSDGTGTPIKLTSSEADDREPSWSQFGLAFTSDRSGNKEIWMIEDINNPNPFRLTSSEAEDKEPCWAPIAIPLSDGSSRPLITFASTRNDNQDIFVMDTDGIDQSKSLTDYTNTDCNPTWSPDGTKVAYASYKDGQYDIWVMTFGINTTALSVRTQQSSQKPRLQKPTSDSKVETLRPAFEWIGVQGITDYRVELGKTLSWATPTRKFTKTISQTEAATAEPSVIYAIHEFDEGLDHGDWYWKVIAISGTQETASDDTWHFTIEPDLTLSGITNYPNPFNPNHSDPNQRKTKIRYRLSTDASEVKIRIYDITGSLVTELDGTTNGEGSSIWNKYNDVDWDGRNGRGDLVLNGIYPFEIVARLGDESVSGRGKIALLK